MTTVLILLASGATPAAQPPYGGGYCQTLLRRLPPDSLWIGKFSAGRAEEGEGGEEDDDDTRDIPDTSDDPAGAITTEACFRRKADCERWLYRMSALSLGEPRWRYCAPFTRQPARPPRP